MSYSILPPTPRSRQSSTAPDASSDQADTSNMIAIYARVSTSDQADRGFSLPEQIAACRAMAQQEGYAVPDTHVFVDDYTGMSLNRPQLRHLRDLVHQHLVRAVFVYDWDRLSRKLAHQILLDEEFEQAGVALRFPTMPNAAKSPETRLVAHMRGSIAEYEREKLLERTKRGRRGRVRAGNPPYGRRPFGYLYVKHAAPARGAHYEVCHDEAAVVKRIFKLYTQEGVSRDHIAALLTEEGVPTPTGQGKPWHPSTVGVILQNEAYIGTLYDGKTQNVPGKRNPDRHTRHRHVPREEWIAVACPAIIDRATFEAAQALRARNKNESKRNRKHDYLFINGRLRCGQCGRAMIGFTNQRGYALYRCSRARHFDVLTPHTKRIVRAAAIEPEAWLAVESLLGTPHRIVAEFKRRQAAIGTKQSDLDHERQHYERQLARDEEALKRWQDAYEQKVIDLADFAAKKAEVGTRRARAEQELARLEAQQHLIKQAELGIAALKEFLARERQNILNYTMEEKRRAIEALDVEVVWYPDAEPKITLNIPIELRTPFDEVLVNSPWGPQKDTLVNTPKCTDVHQLISA
jgi:site-specific DNA recombinase